MPLNPTETQTECRTWLWDMLFLTLGIGVLFFIFAGTRPLLAPDEGRYAEIAREMISAGNYVTPYLDGIKYFEKPALFYWLEVAAIKAFGLSIWSLRSVNVLCGLFGCLLTYFTARTLYNRQTGLLAAGVLATSMLYFAMTHMISLDLPVTVFLSGCLYCFLLGIETPPSNKRRYYIWSAAIFSALAVLTKGLIGIVFPAMIIFPWLLLTGNWRQLKSLYIPSALIIFSVIAVPWHVLVNYHNPEFFNFYFITQHVLRYTDKDVGHYQPVWFFVPSLFLGFFPWIMFLPQTIMASLPPRWRERKLYQKEIFFLLWATLIFLFFSFSKSKLIPYILPTIPPLAILSARYLQKINSNIRNKLSFLGVVVTALFFSYVLYTFPLHSRLPNTYLAQHVLLIAAMIVTGGSSLAFLVSFYRIKQSLSILLIFTGIFFVTTLSAIPYVDTRSILPLATILNSQLRSDDTVITYNQYYQDLPFYLRRQVSILNWRNELTFGMQYQNTSAWMLDNPAFMKKWHGPTRIFTIMKKEEYEGFKRFHPKEEINVLGSTVTNVLLSNQQVSSKQLKQTET